MVADICKLAFVALIVCGACSSGASGAAGGSAVAALATTAAYRGVTGYRCWAACTNGTVCNERTAMCEPIPCDGACKAGQHCNESVHPPQCMGPSDDLKIGRDEPAVPVQGTGEALKPSEPASAPPF